MQILGLVLLGVGGLTAFVGGIWLLVVAFKQSVLWGLLSLFVPFAVFVFIFKYWDKAKQPFLVDLGGVVLVIIGMAMGASMGGGMPGAH